MRAICNCDACQCAYLDAPGLKEKRRDIRRRTLGDIKEWSASRRRRGADDAVIVQACRLLADPPPIDSVGVAPLVDANGRCNRDTKLIRINPDSHAYALAEETGDVRELAALLSHERHHQIFGRGERAAYRVQAATLRRLGADPGAIAFAERRAANSDD